MNNRIEVSGWIRLDDDCKGFTEREYDIAICKENDRYILFNDFLGEIISNNFNFAGEDNYGFSQMNETIENCSIKFYISNEEISLNEVKEKYLRKILGDVKLEGYEYGYSEYTIMGFHYETLTIGGHDLNKILAQHEGKYINFIMEY